MTDSADESNANCGHSVIEVREEVERCEIEISDVGSQTLSGNKNNEDELLASLIETKLPQKLSEADPTCIFRVPNKLVRDNENAFVPQVVSIGPYHHGGKKFHAMEQIKLWNLQRLLDRKPTPDTSLVKFVKEIRSREEFLRSCYDQKIDHLSSDQFVEMMVVDGCFILQVIRACMMNKDHDPYGILSPPGMLSRVQNDLFLLENQLPWKVLDCLFNLTTTSDKSSLHELTLDLTCEIMNNPFIVYYLRYNFMGKQSTTWQFRHLLTNVRDLLVGSSTRNEDVTDLLVGSSTRSEVVIDLLVGSPPWNEDTEEMRYEYWTAIASVTHLEEIGVQFKTAPQHTCLLNITFNFEKGVMEIPRMKIRANTESLFRNLIAYEQCSLIPHYILSYATMFNQLIKSTKDLDRLIQKGIIDTELSKEDTVFLFRRLCNDTECISFLYSKLANDVDRYYYRRWLRRWLARIKRDYLYNPSSIWSVSNAVIVVLILTIIQTVYGVLAYYKQ